MKLVSPEHSSPLPRGMFMVVALAASLVTVTVVGLGLKAAFLTAFFLGVGVVIDLGLFLDSLAGPRFEVDTKARLFRRVCTDHTSTFLATSPGVKLGLHIRKNPHEDHRSEIWTLDDGRRRESFIPPAKSEDRASLMRLLRRVGAEIEVSD